MRNRDADFYIETDPAALRRELDEAARTIRALTRQISYEESQCREAAQSYSKTVAELVQVSRHNAELERDRDTWRQRAEQKLNPDGQSRQPINLTPAEARALRKAMARLHHPDTGGDAERMKQWNAVLDQLEP